MTRPLPSWRSLLFVPVTSERFVAKAHTRGADAIILDLEDSIVPARKAEARTAVAATAPRVAQGGADVVVRINRPLDLAVADIAASVMPGVAALMLPKVMGPEHVRLLAELVTTREEALGMPVGHTRFLALIESPAALPRLFAIAAEPRMAGMSVGGEDFATELGAIPSADSMYVFALQGLAAARAAGILPMGSMGPSSPTSTTSNPTAPDCGAAGRWASPRQAASTPRMCRSSTRSTARHLPSSIARVA
jgi:citrate lyase subunit beta/citryl-CoA lyase